MNVPDNFICPECSAILREMRAAGLADRQAMLSSDRDLTELRDQWLHADESQTYDLYQSTYPRTIAARRRWTEHQILTGHSVLTHGWRGIFRRF